MENKQINDYPDYTIYEDGRIYSLKQNKFLKPVLSGGYSHVKLYGKINKTCNINRLVLEHFREAEIKTKHILHLDGDKQNNNVLNLKYCTFRDLLNTEKIRSKGKKRTWIISPKDKVEAYKYYIQYIQPKELSAYIRVLKHRVEYLIIKERWVSKLDLTMYETAFKSYCNGKKPIEIMNEFGWSARTYNKAFNSVRKQLIIDIMEDVKNGQLTYNYIPFNIKPTVRKKTMVSSLKGWKKYKESFM